MNEEYYKQTKEAYVPQECEFHGCNELGGMMPDPKNPDSPAWVEHCDNYLDRGQADEEGIPWKNN